jgi:hypothetical protein
MTQPAEPMNEQTRFNLSTMIRALAGIGRDDPRIADRLGITVSQVRGIRKEYGIEAGEQRWRGSNFASAYQGSDHTDE